MMKKCSHCGIKILEDSIVCPLCKNVLESNIEENQKSTNLAKPMEYIPMYPVIEFDVHKFTIVFRLFLFLSIVLSSVLLLVNILSYKGEWWAIIGIGAIVYMWVTVIFSIQNNTNSALKILIQTLASQSLIVIIDWSLGYSGWSVNYAIPCILMAADLAVFILMLVNFMNWQSYIMFQIIFVIFSLIPIIFYLVGIITNPMLTFIAAACSLIILAGTLIFGERTAKNELKRRFHL